MSEKRGAEAMILDALTRYTQRTAAQLREMTGLGVVQVYMMLDRLERLGKITGEWEDMPYPRRRRYRLLVERKE